MRTLLRGRVVDAERRAVAGARVTVGPEHGSMGAFVAPDAQSRNVTALTDANGAYAVPVEESESVSLRAADGSRVSRPLVVDPTGASVDAPDLVLMPGVIGRIQVRWDDGTPAPGVSLVVSVSHPDDGACDERGSIEFAAGDTDANGEFAFGPVADRRFARVIVHARHPDAPHHMPWWDDLHLPREGFLRVTLPRGRRVRGRLVTPEGKPAAGYRVAPSTFALERHEIVRTDADGRFEVSGVDPRHGEIVVYDRPPGVPGIASLRLFLSDPVLLREVAPGETDVGTIALPVLGTLTLRLTDAAGRAPGSGWVHWQRRSHSHGSRGHRADAQGTVRISRIPRGIAVRLHLRISDREFGELEQRFDLDEVTEAPLELRVTGAGTMIVRLHPPGAPERPLTVPYAVAAWHVPGEAEC